MTSGLLFVFQFTLESQVGVCVLKEYIKNDISKEQTNALLMCSHIQGRGVHQNRLAKSKLIDHCYNNVFPHS